MMKKIENGLLELECNCEPDCVTSRSVHNIFANRQGRVVAKSCAGTPYHYRVRLL